MQGWLKLLEEGRDPPPVFFEQPEIPLWQQFYWVAFHELSTERQLGMGLGPIPSSSILAYAREYELDRDETSNLVSLVRSLDTEFLQLSNRKLTRRTKKEEKEDRIANEVEEVSTTDLKGVREVMGRLKARAASVAARKKGRASGNT